MKKSTVKKPPKRSKGLLTDILYFLLHKPDKDTRIKYASDEERDDYNQRMMQRTGINPDRYSVLNIHKIGVNAPVSYIFNELLEWSGDSTCWPNHIARVERINNDIKRIRIHTFGWKNYPLRFMKSFFGLKLIPLFELNARRIKEVPDSFDFDNARYLLYNCSGGYPIGVYAMYVRSSIPDMGEVAQSQLIFAVGFNFYGKEDWQKRRKLVNIIWENVHNRVTANVLNRVKQLSEWRIDFMENNHH
jgi:hypothetical protein